MEGKQISIKKAVFLNAGSKYLTVILQIINTGILARIITPEEFGIIGILYVFITFFQLLADMGFGTAVIQNKTLSRLEVDLIFSFTIFLGIILMLLFAGASFVIAAFYNNRVLIPLGWMLSVSLLFNSFNMIPNSVMLKNKKFLAMAIRTIVVSILTYAITITLAILGFGVFALAANSIIMAFSLFVWNEVSTKIHFRWKIDIPTIKKVWGYSLFQFGAQSLNYFNRNLDNLLIGKCFTATDLGYYNKAYTLAGYPITYLPGVVTPALHPILSEHQDDKEYIYNSYLKILKCLSLLGCVCSLFCFFASREIILIAFGSQWEASIIPFKILSLSLWMQIQTNTIAPIYQSLGNTKLLFKSTIFTTILIVNSIIIGVFCGSIISVSTCVSIAYMLNFFLSFGIMMVCGFRRSFFEFLSNFKAELLFFIIMLAITFFWPFEIENVFISFLSKFLFCSVLYVFMLFISKQYKHLHFLFK